MSNARSSKKSDRIKQIKKTGMVFTLNKYIFDKTNVNTIIRILL